MTNRPSSYPGHLVGIQYLRGIAATMVALHHTLEESYAATSPLWRAPDWLTTFGAAGVDIFFVISGLVMLHASFPSGGGSDRAGAFLIKRFIRIFPLYWLCLAGLFACWAIGFYRTLDPEPLFILRNALLWPGQRLALGVSWTLSYELYFYAIFSLMLLARSRKVAVLGTLALLCVGLAVAPHLPHSEPVRLLGNPIVLEFAMGLAIAYWLPALSTNRWQRWLAVPAFIMLVASSALIDHATTNELPMPGRLLGWGLTGACIVFAFTAISQAPGYLHSLLKLVGDASYSVYLTHPFLMLAYAWVLREIPLLRDRPQPLMIILVVVGCVVSGILVHKVVEVPVTRFARRWHRRPPKEPAAVGPLTEPRGLQA